MIETVDDPGPTPERAGPRDSADSLADPPAEARAVLQEVDHRVKNNLQLIASLIQLQARRSSEPAAREALSAVLQRVNAVATVHRRLFQGDVQRFEAADFLRDLAGDMAAAAGRDDLEIALSLEAVQIPAASAAAFALVASELVGNALRHAFPAGRGGRISIALTQDAGACVLTVADNGVGVGDAPQGIGLALTRLMCQQLHARFEFGPAEPIGGVRAVVRTPLVRSTA